jgi:hypothetical protein
MATINLQNYVAGAYLVSIRVPRPPYFAPFMPEMILSASPCISATFPDSWAIEWCSETPEQRLQFASRFGIPESALGDILKSVTAAFDKDLHFPNVCDSCESARKFAAMIAPHCKAAGIECAILGLALHRDRCGILLEEAKPPPQEEGFAPMGEMGIYKMIARNEAPASDGVVLGFEPLVYSHGLSCSWLCNSLEVPCRDKLEIGVNAEGFIDTAEDADRAIDYISDEKTGAEPGLWLPWLMIRYPLQQLSTI